MSRRSLISFNTWTNIYTSILFLFAKSEGILNLLDEMKIWKNCAFIYPDLSTALVSRNYVYFDATPMFTIKQERKTFIRSEAVTM